MTDRELLERAAIAAGFGSPDGRVIWTESEYPRGSASHGALWNGRGYMDTAELWNPLTDDGDALRLAVKLRISPSFVSMPEGGLHCYVLNSDGVAIEEAVGQDEYTAVRHAIVRAAASLAATPAPKE